MSNYKGIKNVSTIFFFFRATTQCFYTKYLEFKRFRLIILHSGSPSSLMTTFFGTNVFFCFGNNTGSASTPLRRINLNRDGERDGTHHN
ncbi:MAG: hypothetical protein M3P08_10425 [Thermoproteota archaeon]|nr:hypothetical protein [Thermoproteota archaeon]